MKCKQCNKELTPPKRKFCTKSCGDKYHQALPQTKATKAKYYKEKVACNREVFSKVCKYEECDNEFTTTSERQVYCCSEHAVLQKRANDKAKRLANKPFIYKQCGYTFCDKTFSTNKYHHVYCSRKCSKRHLNGVDINNKKTHTGVKPVVKKKRAKKKYTLESKPKVKPTAEKVVEDTKKSLDYMFEKKRDDVLVVRAYTDHEADMVSKFLASR